MQHVFVSCLQMFQNSLSIPSSHCLSTQKSEDLIYTVAEAQMFKQTLSSKSHNQ